MFKPDANNLCSRVAQNALMHETARRLYEAVGELTGQRLTELSAVASFVGISPQVLKNWETRGISKQGQLELQKSHGINPLWISTGSGAPFTGTRESQANTEPGPDLRGKVPLISWVQAGSWCGAVETLQPGEAERWMDCPVSHSSKTFALRVRGDSMTAPHGNTRTYPQGCFIFVDPERRDPCNGDRVVARLNETDEVTFKIYKNEDGRQWLQPLNPSHEPIRANFSILGTVLGKWEDG